MSWIVDNGAWPTSGFEGTECKTFPLAKWFHQFCVHTKCGKRNALKKLNGKVTGKLFRRVQKCTERRRNKQNIKTDTAPHTHTHIRISIQLKLINFRSNDLALFTTLNIVCVCCTLCTLIKTYELQSTTHRKIHNKLSLRFSCIFSPLNAVVCTCK